MHVFVLTIVGIVEIYYFAPAIKLYCINDGLMIIRAHAEGKIEETRRWRKHLKRENYGKQRSHSVLKETKTETEHRASEREGIWQVSKHESLLSSHCYYCYCCCSYCCWAIVLARFGHLPA